MAFEFKLRQLLQIALHEENEVKNRLAKKDAQIAELATKIQSFKDQQTQALAEQQQAMFSGDLMKVQMYPPYIQSLKKSEDFYTNEMQLQQKQRAKIMAEYVEKQRKRKTFEKMEEVDRAKYTKQMQKKEQARLDEFGGRKRNTLMEPDNA